MPRSKQRVALVGGLAACVLLLQLVRRAAMPPTELQGPVYRPDRTARPQEPLHDRIQGMHDLSAPFFLQAEQIAQEFSQNAVDTPQTNSSRSTKAVKRATIYESSATFLQELERFRDSVRAVTFQTTVSELTPHVIHNEFPVTRDTCNISSSFPPVTRGPVSRVKASERFKPCQTDKHVGMCTRKQTWLLGSSGVALSNDDRPVWGYVVVVRNGCVTKDGDYYNEQVAVHIKQCRPRPIPGNTGTPQHEAVFSIAQYWGYGFGHFLTEDLPRIGPYVEMLRASPNIKIHANSNSGFVKAWIGSLGIDPDRIIVGNYCARILYVPEGSPCGGGEAFPLQQLAMHLRADQAPVPSERRRRIIFIEQTQHRVMRNRRQMTTRLNQLTAPYNFTVHLFSDSHLPPLPEAKRLFNEAFMIFTNYGAGEGNMILAPTGTLVFECSLFSGNANGSFHKYSKLLGHKLFTYISRDCTSVDAETLMEHVKQYLPLHSNIVTDTCPLHAPT